MCAGIKEKAGGVKPPLQSDWCESAGERLGVGPLQGKQGCRRYQLLSRVAAKEEA